MSPTATRCQKSAAGASAVSGAVFRGQELEVHGWIYGLSDGRLRDLGISISALDAIETKLAAALATVSLVVVAFPGAISTSMDATRDVVVTTIRGLGG